MLYRCYILLSEARSPGELCFLYVYEIGALIYYYGNGARFARLIRSAAMWALALESISPTATRDTDRCVCVAKMRKAYQECCRSPSMYLTHPAELEL